MAEDPRALDEIRAIVKGISALRSPDRRRVVDFLARANAPGTGEMLGGIMEDEALGSETRLTAAEALLRMGDASRAGAARRTMTALRPALSVEEPQVTIIENPWRPSPVSTPPQPLPKKKEDSELPIRYKITLGATAAVLAVLLLRLRRRN